jgi:hypothetical protein
MKPLLRLSQWQCETGGTVAGDENHGNCEIPGKHAENGDPSRSLPLRAVVQAPVSILEVLRAAPRMIDQKPYPRLNRAPC